LGGPAAWLSFLAVGCLVATAPMSVTGVVIAIAVVGWLGAQILPAVRRQGPASGDVRAPAPNGERALCWAIRLFPTLFAIAVHSHSTVAVVALGVACLTPLYLQLAQRSTKLHGIPLAVVAYLLVAGMTWVRNPATRPMLIVGLAFVALIVGIGSAAHRSHEVLALAVLDSLALYMVVSVVAYFVLGLRSPADANRLIELDSAVSSFGPRITFPFATAITTPPAMAAAYLAGFLPVRRRQAGLVAAWRLLAAALAIVMLLASNGRFAVLALLIVAPVIRRPKRAARWLPVLALLGVCIPLWWGAVRPAFAPAGAAIANVQGIDRGRGASDLLTFNRRTQLWSKVRLAAGEMPMSRQLVGWGARGQIRSGLWRPFVAVLGRYVRDPTGTTAHSSLLQQFLDAGAIGALALLALIGTCARQLSHWTTEPATARGKEAALSCSAVFAVLALTGGLDATLAPGHLQEPLWIVLLIAVIVHGARRSRGSVVVVADSKSLTVASC
jgi:hypothetical protein